MQERKLTINNNVHQGNHVGTTRQISKDFYLPFDFFGCNRFQDFDNALFVAEHVKAFKNLP